MMTPSQKFHQELQVLKQSVKLILQQIEELELHNSGDLPVKKIGKIDFEKRFPKDRWINGGKGAS